MQRKKAEKNQALRDMPNKENDFEIILFSENDNDSFQVDWCEKRKKHGSYLLDIDLHETPINLKNIKYLTKVGHGGYEDDDLCMLGFTDYDNSTVIDRFKNVLEIYPTIQRINLYACKSGLPPIACDLLPLRKRLSIQMDGERFQYGALSFAEYFILALEERFRKEGNEFPSGLFVVACLGDVKENSGKAGISHNVRLRLASECYVKYDPTSKFCMINCDLFIKTYRLLNQHELNISLSSQRATLFATSNASCEEFTETLSNSGASPRF